MCHIKDNAATSDNAVTFLLMSTPPFHFRECSITFRNKQILPPNGLWWDNDSSVTFEVL